MHLPDLLEKLSDVEETTDGYLATCPAHNDSHASLRVTVSEAGKVLVRCRAMCDTPAVMSAIGLTMRDLARMTPGDEVPRNVKATSAIAASPAAIAKLAVTLDAYQATLATAEAFGDSYEGELNAARDALLYAEHRFGINATDAERLGLGFVDNIGGGPRLVVPFRTPDGVARGFQARALEKDAAVRWLGPKAPEDGSWSPLGYFPGASGWDEVLICEGPGDALTGATLGYDTIGIAGAARVNNPAILDEVASWIGDREAVIAGDGDPAGRRFSATLAEGLSKRDIRVRVLSMADGLDLTDWRRNDPQGFSRDVIRAITQAKPVKSREAALLAWDESTYALSDLGGARYLRDYLKSRSSGVKYTSEAGFLLLEDGVWRIDDRQSVRTHAQAVADVVKRLAREANSAKEAGGTDEERDRAKARAGRFTRYSQHVQTSRGIDSMLRELQAVEGVPSSINDFDQHPDLLAVNNGVIDLRAGELRPHDPGLLLSRKVSLTYHAEAKAPRWEAFLAEVFPRDRAMPDFMRRLIGYGITGHTTEQCFVIHLGKGANGKSVFTDTLTEVFREITTTTPFSTFESKPSGGIPNDLAALKGARLVMASEGEQGKRMAEAMLKRVTGRDLIAARFMRQEFFEFRPAFLLQMGTNFEPQFRGQDEGLWRRVKLVNWERWFAPHERDARLGDKLLEEAEGILAWAVRGSVEWYANGLGDPATVREASKQYRDTSDILQGFLPGVFELADEEHKVKGADLWAAFQSWAEEENLRDLQGWSRRAFYGALKERGIHVRKEAVGQVFVGVKRTPRVSAHPEQAAPEIARAGVGTQAHSSATPITGADLSAL
ncbi:putative DNA primase/helicase [Microbacterium resistens]|uniref:DNA primase/helicase n=1 Tax=Microbacterium resistens TaxID=156977 RepID=A0ABU1SGL8_9MICO|nr:phage/plasmid primase, P4 family [Microbacterium resistens]MDR6868754.1 putative DNA primase/helicase [Microbacterium resistens]